MNLLLLAPFLAFQEVDLEAKIAPILPTQDEERWMEVPWRRNLLEARREANNTGKPIFMWLMDGDPLGCT